MSVPIFCYSTLRDYFGLIFDDLLTVFDSRGKFSRLNLFFILSVKKLLQEVYYFRGTLLWKIVSVRFLYKNTFILK
jgi:hypothetical protein